MISFPRNTDAAVAALKSGDAGQPVVRAGGTDLQHRRGLGLSAGPLVDLRDTSGLDQIGWRGDRLAIGASVRVAEIAASPLVSASYPALAEAASDLANPQIRARATLGGNLLQRNRCWYYRHPGYTCLKKGGATCYAREGDHLFHSCFDLGPCVAPHPSTLGLALVAYEADIEVQGAPSRSAAALYGDGSQTRNDHTLEPEALVTGVLLPPPLAGERSAYVRVAHRTWAEWPLVDVVARLRLEGNTIAGAWVALGGVANIPLRMRAVEEKLVGQPAQEAALRAAAEVARTTARPLPDTAYKVELLAPAIVDALQRALAHNPVSAGLPAGG